MVDGGGEIEVKFSKGFKYMVILSAMFAVGAAFGYIGHTIQSNADTRERKISDIAEMREDAKLKGYAPLELGCYLYDADPPVKLKAARAIRNIAFDSDNISQVLIAIIDGFKINDATTKRYLVEALRADVTSSNSKLESVMGRLLETMQNSNDFEFKAEIARVIRTYSCREDTDLSGITLLDLMGIKDGEEQKAFSSVAQDPKFTMYRREINLAIGCDLRKISSKAEKANGKEGSLQNEIDKSRRLARAMDNKIKARDMQGKNRKIIARR